MNKYTLINYFHLRINDVRNSNIYVFPTTIKQLTLRILTECPKNLTPALTPPTWREHQSLQVSGVVPQGLPSLWMLIPSPNHHSCFWLTSYKLKVPTPFPLRFAGVTYVEFRGIFTYKHQFNFIINEILILWYHGNKYQVGLFSSILVSSQQKFGAMDQKIQIHR